MSEFRQAAEAASSLAKQFRALLLVGEALNDLVNVDQHLIDLKAATDKAAADLIPVQEALAAANLNLATVRITAAQAKIKSDADATVAAGRVDGIIAAAKAEGQRVYAELKDAGLKIRNQAEALNVQAQEDAKALFLQRSDLEGQIRKLKDELETLRKRFVV